MNDNVLAHGLEVWAHLGAQRFGFSPGSWLLLSGWDESRTLLQLSALKKASVSRNCC